MKTLEGIAAVSRELKLRCQARAGLASWDRVEQRSLAGD